MLSSIIWILLGGFLGGEIVRRFAIPPLVGMILVGFLLSPAMGNRIDPTILEMADQLRTISVMVILLRAGLGLDWAKLKQQGSVAIRLGVLPALSETIVIAIAANFLFGFDLLTGLLLGCIVSAESPAVIVPGMLRLKNLGWGVSKGIPDAILTGSALSDVFIFVLFGLLLNLLQANNSNLGQIWLLPINMITQILLGVFFGFFAAIIGLFCVTRKRLTQNQIHTTLVVAMIALLLIVLAQKFPYFSGYLGVMTLGFYLNQIDPPLGRILREKFADIWIIAEIILFVLLGTEINLEVLQNNLFASIILLIIGLFLGRTIGWYLSTLGSNWTTKEKLFLLPGNSAKATVQAAIGAIPLSQGMAGGEIILAVAVLAILITAPLGAWAIPTFAPKLLTLDSVDPTKIVQPANVKLLAAIDNSKVAEKILKEVANLARKTNGEVILVHVLNDHEQTVIDNLKKLAKHLLLDIRYRFIFTKGEIADNILEIAEQYQVNIIFIGKKNYEINSRSLLGSVTQKVINNSLIPISLIE